MSSFLRFFLPAAALLGVGVLLLPAITQAQSGQARRHQPRPEAIAACKDKSEGAACEFDAPRGHIVGSCKKVHTGDVACVRPHPRGDGGA